MTPEQFEAVQRIFLEVVDLPEDQRELRLAELAANDEVTIREVRAMVAADQHGLSESMTLVDEAIRQLGAELSGQTPDPKRSHTNEFSMAGRQIGPFVIERELGRGGMGVVYLARQQRPARQVALKVARSLTLTPDLLRRFGAEAEILGMLKHPGIAAVYGADTVDTPQGQVAYFALEYVEGVSLDEYIHKVKPDLRSLVGLLARVCAAVGHAHQRGIVHRDLKPGNILVGPDGEPKVLDFGIARVLEDADSAAARSTVVTMEGQVFGTLPYMSPEQVSGRIAEIDSRTDVYALGVIAYESITGALPYRADRSSLQAMSRAICEEDPQLLGTLQRGARGDLETIIAKAMSKEIAQRYRNASELADEMQRYLSEEPILGRPSTATYQMVKFVRRNRGLSAALAAAVAITLLGATATALLAIRATDARNDAIAREQDASLELAKYQAAYDFVASIIQAPDPWALERTGAAARETKVLDVLDAGAAELTEKFTQQPKVEIQLRFLFCETYGNLGENSKALEQAQRAFDLCVAVFGPDDPNTIHAQHMLGSTLLEQGRYREAEPYLKTALEWRERVRGPLHDATLTTLNNYGHVLELAGRDDDALPLHRESVRRRTIVYGADDPRTLVAENNLATLLDSLGRLDESLALQQDVVERRLRALPPDHPSIATSLNNLGLLLQKLMRYDEAEGVLRSVMELRLQHLGPDHEKTHIAMINLGLVLMATERHAEAADLVERAFESMRARGIDDSVMGVTVRNVLGTCFAECGQESDAEDLWREAIEIANVRLPPGHVRTLSTMTSLGKFLAAHGRTDEGLSLIRTVLAMRMNARSGEPAWGEVANCYLNLGTCYATQGEWSVADQAFMQACLAVRSAYGSEDWRFARMVCKYATCLIDAGECRRARPLLERALALSLNARGEEDRVTQEITESLDRVNQLD